MMKLFNGTMWRETIFLRTFGFLKIPLISYLKPKVLELSDQRAVIMLPLTRRSKNHLHSMYFGALSVGADCAGGLIAMKLIRAQGNKVSLVFKDFHAEFLKRPEGDVYFTSQEGDAIQRLVEKATLSGERENMPVHITATCPDKTGDEPIAKFTLTLSLKKKSKK